MITSSKVFEFADRLEAVVNGFSCDMSEDIVCREDHICETPACHGGWAYIALRGFPKRTASYRQGSQVLAEFFGFPSTTQLEEWAGSQPIIWGNPWGDGMFSNPDAFGELRSNFPAMKLVEHWRSVGQRLQESGQ